jgi:hypothetical protein
MPSDRRTGQFFENPGRTRGLHSRSVLTTATTKNQKFSDDEAQRRFMQSLKAAVNTPPKPLKSMTRKRPKKQSKKKKG